MNALDIIIFAVICIGLFRGWMCGLIVQLFSLGGLVLALVSASTFGVHVGHFLGLEGGVALLMGFVAVFILVVVSAGYLGRQLQRLFRFVGLGALDGLFGALLGGVKYALVLSLAIWFIHPFVFNPYTAKPLNESSLYCHLHDFNDYILPSWEWAQGEIQNHIIKPLEEIQNAE